MFTFSQLSNPLTQRPRVILHNTDTDTDTRIQNASYYTSSLFACYLLSIDFGYIVSHHLTYSTYCVRMYVSVCERVCQFWSTHEVYFANWININYGMNVRYLFVAWLQACVYACFMLSIHVMGTQI